MTRCWCSDPWPALQHPLPDLSESPWWEEGQSLVKPPPVPLVPGAGQGAGPGQYWQGRVAGGQGGYTAPPPGHSMLPPGPNPGYPGYPGYPGHTGSKGEDWLSSLRSMFGVPDKGRLHSIYLQPLAVVCRRAGAARQQQPLQQAQGEEQEGDW